MAVINKQTVSFEVYMQEVAAAAKDDSRFELGYTFPEHEFYGYYQEGCDVDEALLKHHLPF